MVQVGMLFAIIFTIMLIGFVLALGMDQIMGLFCLGSDAQASKAVKDIGSVASEVFILSTGSSKTYALALPADAKICFVNKDNPNPYPWQDPAKTWNPDRIILENFLLNPNSTSYGSNVWFYHCSNAKLGEGYAMKYLSPSKSFCASSKDRLFIENRGSFVDISPLE